MNRWQKIAWFNIMVVIACFMACLVLAAIITFGRAATPPTPLSIVIIPSLILVAISKIIFYKQSKRVDFDERDIQIHKKSHYVGLWAFVIAIVLLNVICVLLLGPKRALDYPLVLLLMVCAAGGIWIMMDSIATLVQYGREPKGEQS
jgi:phosphatidylglycerophosphate synthase